MSTIIWYVLLGLAAGLLARAIVPGNDSMNIFATLLLGLLGSFAGGALAAVFTSSSILDFNPSGIILSIVGACALLLIYNRFARRT